MTMELLEQGRFLGEEFALWLWMRGLTEGGTSGAEGDTSAVTSIFATPVSDKSSISAIFCFMPWE